MSDIPEITPTMNKRVLVIGLDGATWDLLDPWITQGRLPNLGKLKERGCTGDLLSTIHPVTTPAWTSFMTGKNQGGHGIYDHVQRKEGSYNLEVMDATRIGSPLLFDYLGAENKRSISINMPLTFPPRALNGLMVSGLFGTLVGPEITYPPELFARIAQISPGYVVHPDYDPRADRPLEKYVGDLLKSIDDRTAVAEKLLAEEVWDLALVVYTATDQIQHAFWRDMDDEQGDSPFKDAIFNIYKRIDDHLPRLLKHIDDQTLVLVMSDHGAGVLHGFVNINRWLADEGLLAVRSGVESSLRSRLITQAAAAYKRYLPAALRASIRKNMQDQFTGAKARMETELFSAAIDWQKTQAYSIGAGGNIFINLAGREPLGTVEPGEAYEQLRERIRSRIKNLKAPDGSPLVKDVLAREEIYQGPFHSQAPDLVIVWHDYGWWGRARYNQSDLKLFEIRYNWDFSSLPLTGSHRPEGVLMAAGPAIPTQSRITDAYLIDLAPTILAYMGIAVPQSMHGLVLERLFDGGLSYTADLEDQATTPNQDAFSFTAEEEAKISQHLKDLGYL